MPVALACNKSDGRKLAASPHISRQGLQVTLPRNNTTENLVWAILGIHFDLVPMAQNQLPLPTTQCGKEKYASHGHCRIISLQINSWGWALKPQPQHRRGKYEQRYGPKTVEFALLWSIRCHILSRCLFIFLPCVWGGGGHSRIPEFKHVSVVQRIASHNPRLTVWKLWGFVVDSWQALKLNTQKEPWRSTNWETQERLAIAALPKHTLRASWITGWSRSTANGGLGDGA